MKTAARILVTLILVAAACVGGYELWNYYMFSPWTRDARVQADVVSIAPDVSGFVDEVRVKDNQFVHLGRPRSRTLQPRARHRRGQCRRPQGADGYAPARSRAARQANDDRDFRRGA